MDSVKVESPFRSPNVNSLPPRSRGGSGSSSSSDKQSPAGQTPTNRYSHGHQSSHSAASVSVGDENDPPQAGPSSTNGEYSRINPFEKDVLAGLHRSFWSPSIMEIPETPPQRSWAIEHLSHLFPKDLENSPSTHQNSLPVDAQTEAKAQADIDTYFSRSVIVPTPSPIQKDKVTHIQYSELSRFNKTTVPFIHMGQSPISRGGVGGSNGAMKKKKQVHVVEKWTQTALSFPIELPEHVEDVLSQYFQPGDLCGTFREASAGCSQRSEASEHNEGMDIDSAKNSSLNTSIRRRLDLSFGDDDSNELPASPISLIDPFRRNHMVSTPPTVAEINTTTSELEVQLMRCEFTPEARGIVFAVTPGITPIHDEADETRSNACSTPRRTNSSSRRWTVKENSLFPVSPMEECSPSRFLPKPGSSSENVQINLRRCRVVTPKERKTIALSLDDSKLMDVFSPPTKMCRRSLENENS